MFLDGHHSIELGCPMLLNYLSNIENIGGLEWVAPYRACLTALDDQVLALDTLQHADITAIAEIEVAHQRAEMIAWQEEFHLQEEVWTIEASSL